MGKKRYSLIIDTDLGPDDYMAILLLLRCEFTDVLGFSTVAGLANAKIGAKNLARFLHFAGYEGYSINSGAEKPLLYDPRRYYWENYFNPVADLIPKQFSQNPILSNERCEDFLYQKITQSDEKVTLVCLGPLTNISNLLSTYPDVDRKIEQIVLTARYLVKKQVVNGWNIIADPIASHNVVNSGIRLVIVGVDQDKSIPITPEMLDSNYQIAGNAMSRFVLDLNRMTSKEIHEGSWFFWDQCTAACLLEPDIAEWKEFSLVSENKGNWISLKDQLPSNAKATLTIDHDKFMTMFDSLLSQYSL